MKESSLLKKLIKKKKEDTDKKGITEVWRSYRNGDGNVKGCDLKS